MLGKVDLTVFSDLVLDLYFGVHGFPINAGSTIVSPKATVSIGGAATVAVSASRLGLNVEVVDRVGQDVFSMILLRELEKQGVGVRNVTRVRGAGTSTCVVLFDGGDSHVYVGTLGPTLTLEDFDHCVAARPRAVFFDGYSLLRINGRVLKGFLRRLSDYRALGGKAFFDPGPVVSRLNHLEDVVGACDVVLLNSDEARVLENMVGATLRGLSLRGVEVVEKEGAKGATLYSGGSVHQCPTMVSHLKSSVGAGDVFDATYIWATLKGYSAVDRCRLSNIAAALKIRGVGVDSIPSKSSVLRAARNSGTHPT